MKNLCVVCDSESDYARRFMEYENQKKTFPMEIAACTSLEALHSLSEKRKIDVLLVSERTFADDALSVGAGKTFILAEDGEVTGYENIARISKYQSCDTVLRSVMSCYEAEEAALYVPYGETENKKLIGVFSPAGGCGKTLFALALGQMLGMEAPSLYMNFECCSGVDIMLKLDTERSISDLLYFSAQKDRLLAALAASAQTRLSLDCVPGALSSDDIHTTDPYEWTRVLGTITAHSRYENIVIELGPETRLSPCLMDQCSKIYMPVRSDPVSRARVTQFMQMLAKSPYAGVIGRIIPVSVPPFEGSMENICDELIWSSIGDYVRALLKEDEDDGTGIIS